MENEDKDEAKDGVTEAHKVPREIQPNLSQATKDSLSGLADAVFATSNATQSNIPPNSFPDLGQENIGKADC